MKIQKKMKNIEIYNEGPNYSLKQSSAKVPEIFSGEVLIKVKAAGINRADIFQAQGKYPPPKNASHIPGLEIAGTVVKKSNDVHTLKVGDNVCSLLTGGGYADYASAHSELCFKIPQHIEINYASGLPEAIFTSWHNIFQLGKLQSNEKILIHGGSSGIGSIAIQMAKQLQSIVYTTAGNDEKCQVCKDLGANLAINYRNDNFFSVIKNLDNKGVDVILDMVGGDYINNNLKLLNVNGRLVFIAFLNGSKADVDWLRIMTKRLIVTGSTLRAQTLEEKIEIAISIRKNIWPLVQNNLIKPVIDSVYPFSKAMDAHKRMLSGQHIGKILLINE